MEQYNIYYGFKGEELEYKFTTLCENQDHANQIAYYEAYHEYDFWSDAKHLPTFEDAKKEASEITFEDPALAHPQLINQFIYDIYESYVHSYMTFKAIPTNQDNIKNEDLILDYIDEGMDNSCKSCSERE